MDTIGRGGKSKNISALVCMKIFRQMKINIFVLGVQKRREKGFIKFVGKNFIGTSGPFRVNEG